MDFATSDEVSTAGHFHCCYLIIKPLFAQIVALHLPHHGISPNHLLSTMAGAEMTGSATEQSDVAMDSSLAVPAGPARQIDSTGSVHAMNLGTLPSVSQLQWEIHVDFNNGMWWAMPHDLSDPILEQWINGAQQVSFVWDWEETRRGSYRPDRAETSLNRYMIDFDVMRQRNLDNNRTRIIKVVCVLRRTADHTALQCYRAC